MQEKKTKSIISSKIYKPGDISFHYEKNKILRKKHSSSVITFRALTKPLEHEIEKKEEKCVECRAKLADP